MGVLDVLMNRTSQAQIPGQARKPRSWQLSDFIADQQGVDALTTSTATMLHDMDTITLVNPYEGVKANFEVKWVVKVYTRALWWNVSEDTEEAVEELILDTGQSKTYTLDEGAWINLGVSKVGRDMNIYVTLKGVDELTASGDTVTTYALPGVVSFRPGGYWTPQNIISRVRGRRMFIGPLRLQVVKHPQIGLTPKEREEYMAMVKAGKVSNPIQAAMIRSAYVYDDTREWKNDLQKRLRPY